jgi:hypothetical protein
MSDEAVLVWLKEAERCRRIAKSVGDDFTSARLIELAAEYEAKARATIAPGHKERPKQ